MIVSSSQVDRFKLGIYQMQESGLESYEYEYLIIWTWSTSSEEWSRHIYQALRNRLSLWATVLWHYFPIALIALGRREPYLKTFATKHIVNLLTMLSSNQAGRILRSRHWRRWWGGRKTLLRKRSSITAQTWDEGRMKIAGMIALEWGE